MWQKLEQITNILKVQVSSALKIIIDATLIGHGLQGGRNEYVENNIIITIDVSENIARVGSTSLSTDIKQFWSNGSVWYQGILKINSVFIE